MNMRLKKYSIVVALLIGSFASIGQDIHFSQFNSAPLLLNPALAGVNSGNYRFAANYKNQWSDLAPYNTFAASFDMNVFKHGPRANFGGIGLFFFTDRAGDGNLSTTQVNLNLSYTVMLNKRGTQSITTGVMGGFGHRSVDFSAFTFDSQYGSNGPDQSLSSGENLTNDNLFYPEVGAGILWNYVKNDRLNFYAGGSASHLSQPNLSFFSTRDEKLYIKFTVHGGGYIGLSEQVFLLPSFLYLNQGPHNQLNFGTLIKIKKSALPSEKISFYIGGWYRLLDALILNARVDIGRINIGFSYDINLSGLTEASRANGGPELSFIYTGVFPSKKQQIKFCPPML